MSNLVAVLAFMLCASWVQPGCSFYFAAPTSATTQLVSNDARTCPRSHMSLQMSTAPAAEAEAAEMIRQYMVRAAEEKLRAIEAARLEVEREYEAKMDALRASGPAPSAPAASAGSQGISLQALEELRGRIMASIADARGGVAPAPPAPAASVASPASASVASVSSEPAPTNGAYLARARRPGWELRWGLEEPARVGAAQGGAASAPVASVAVESAAANGAYLARARRPGWEMRWGSEEPARVGAARGGVPELSAAHGSAAQPPAVAAAAQPATANTAYQVRTKRPGWQERWGPEEPLRLQSQLRPLEGAVTAGGAVAAAPQPTTANAAYQEPARVAASAVTASAPVEVSAPVVAQAAAPAEGRETIEELKRQIKQHQEYLSAFMIKTHADKIQLTQRVAIAEGQLEEKDRMVQSLQQSFSDYMTRSLEARLQAVEAARAEALASLGAADDPPATATQATPPSGPAANGINGAALQAPAGGANAAYERRQQRVGWDDRWGSEELARICRDLVAGVSQR